MCLEFGEQSRMAIDMVSLEGGAVHEGLQRPLPGLLVVFQMQRKFTDRL